VLDRRQIVQTYFREDPLADVSWLGRASGFKVGDRHAIENSNRSVSPSLSRTRKFSSRRFVKSFVYGGTELTEALREANFFELTFSRHFGE
jgi:hypothetical protein